MPLFDTWSETSNILISFKSSILWPTIGKLGREKIKNKKIPNPNPPNILHTKPYKILEIPSQTCTNPHLSNHEFGWMGQLSLVNIKVII